MSTPTSSTPADPAYPAPSGQPSGDTTTTPDGATISTRPTHQLPTTYAPGLSHDQLKQMIDSAQPHDAFGLSSEWVKLSDEMRTFATDMRGVAQNTQASWVGVAGDAAQGA